MNTESTLPNGESIPPHAMSIYGQNDAMEDFPVLKAFQQYIDAEQAKAQKRMTTLCIFFALILTLVIGVFVLLLLNVGHRNNALNEQLFQFMIKDREQRSQNVSAQNSNDAIVKTLSDSMSSLQKQMSDQQMKLIEQQAKIFEQQAKIAEEKAKQIIAPIPPVQLSKAEEEKKITENEKVKKAIDRLNAEKEEIIKEKEALRREKIELQRRRLYPEFYENEDAKKRTTQKQEIKASPKKDSNDLEEDDEAFDEFLSYFDNDDEKEKATTPDKKVAPKIAPGPQVAPKETEPVLSGWDIPL